MARTGAAERWASQLSGWRIPDEILAAAPRSPWIHPVELFRAAAGPAPESPSRQRALEALPAGGSVLDVGCGGGRAALALAPPAADIVGVDHQQAMLDTFAEAAPARGLGHAQLLGDWPDVAEQAPPADVVVCHHVVYNVADLSPFAIALDAHARRRVVLELPQRHPLAGMAPLWRHFWGLERPDGPQRARRPRRPARVRSRGEARGMDPGRGPRAGRAGADGSAGGVHAYPAMPDPGQRRGTGRRHGRGARRAPAAGDHLVGRRP